MAGLLQHLDYLPDGFLEVAPQQLSGFLAGPSLIELPGRRVQPLFVSVLLHGNETTGFLAIQSLLRSYADRELPRSLSLFIGNIDAASDGVRRLAGQPDYNRVWPGSEYPDSPEQRMMSELYDIMKQRNPFASIDVHNNTGINPHYACINSIEHRFMQLASLFSRTLVYFTRPTGVQSMAFTNLCPSVTVECGKAGTSAGVEHAREFLDACLHLSEIPDHSVAAHDVDLFHTVAIVKVLREYSFGFGDKPADIRFIDDLDHLNFREIPSGTVLAQLDNIKTMPLEALSESSEDLGGCYFTIEDGVLRTTRAVMPSMFTLDERVIHQDCLGYLMERYPL